MKTRFFTLLAIGAALLLAGCDQGTTMAPESSQDEQEDVAAKLVISKTRAGGQWASTRPVQVFPTIDPAKPVAGSAKVTRTHQGMTAILRSSGLSPGTTVSLWWVVFNHPEKCATSPCTAADLKNPAAMPDLLGNPGQVIGQDGNATLTGQIAVGNTDHSYINQEAGMTPIGLTNPMGAEVHLVLRSHGPAIPGMIDEQTSTFNGGCPPNTCGNARFSIHMLPESRITSTRPVQVFPTIDAGTPVAGSAKVFRTRRGMTATLRSSGLSPGTAVSMWWVVFNYPEKCATSPCTAADLKNPEVMPDMLGNPGQVIGQDGNANLTGQISVGSTDHSYINQNFGMTPVGLMDPMGAEVHLVLRSHGAAIADLVDEQISTFNGGCPPNNCGNARFSIHMP